MTAAEIAKAALGIEWRNTESAARRVAEYAADTLAAQAAEIERLRKALVDTGNNLGAVLGPLATTDFLMGVPEEARLVVERLTLRYLNADNALADRARRCVVLATEKADAEARADALAARVADLEWGINLAGNILFEINPSNYEHDDVCRLNDASVEVLIAVAALQGAAPAGEGGGS